MRRVLRQAQDDCGLWVLGIGGRWTDNDFRSMDYTVLNRMEDPSLQNNIRVAVLIRGLGSKD